MPKVSDEHKDAVRRRIMDAALVCLRRADYADVTTRELLAEAGLSTGTFYNYFPTKEHLYEALAEELLGEDTARLVAAAESGQSVGYGLVRFLADYVMVDPEAAVAVSTFRGRLHASDDAAAAIGRLNEFIVREFSPLVATAQLEGYLRDDLDPEAAVELLDLIWDGLGRRQATGTFQTSYQRVGEVVLRVLIGGILAPGTSVAADETRARPTPPPNARYRPAEAGR